MPTRSSKANAEDAADQLGKVVRIGQLADLYGGLLTERQRTFIQLHYEEDLSFGEIAKTYNVSRQAIHDAVKHAEHSLEDYESKLHLLDRGFSRTAEAETKADLDAGADGAGQRAEEEASDRVPSAGAQDAAKRLRALEDRLRKSGGIIYNADGVIREIGEIAGTLEETNS